MFTKKKKIIILASMLLLLIVTGFLNVKLNAMTDSQTQSVSSSYNAGSFFATYREDRNATRSESIAYYDAIISSSYSSKEAIASAEEKRQELIEAMTLELTMEGLIKSKGFDDAIVSCSDEYVNVIVKADSLKDGEVSQIVEVVQGQTKKDIDYIKIIPVE
jgi:stage III sporulation protein AH